MGDALALGSVLLTVGFVLLAGCIGNAGPSPAAVEPTETASSNGNTSEPTARINLTDRDVSGTGVVTWNGSEPSSASEGCSNPCHRVPFTVQPTDGGPVGDQLVVSATWDPYQLPHNDTFPRGQLNVTVLGPNGSTVGRGPSVYWSSAAIVADPEPGSYVALIQVSEDAAVFSEGTTPYKGAVHVQQAPAKPDNGSPRDLLPDLVVQPVIHVTRDTPPLPRGGPPDSGGCDYHEQAEHGAQNCLRFTTSIGNLGKGPFEIRMAFENATRAIARGLGAPVDAQFTQAIYQADGSRREVAVGHGEYHPAHRHFHKEGVANFTLYAYDRAHGTRGEVVREGHKSSWCLVDMGLAAPGAGPDTQRAHYPIDGARTQPQTRSNCIVSTPNRDMVTGVSPGWYDMYEWNQPDQYIEVTGLEDGTYELVTTVDPSHQFVETDPDNNAAGVVFAFSNGEPTVLERWSEGVPDR